MDDYQKKLDDNINPMEEPLEFDDPQQGNSLDKDETKLRI
jgi:hypothetical protein